MEPADHQNFKKPKSGSSVPFAVAVKLLGVFKLPSFREGFLITICFVLMILLLQLNLFPLTIDVKVGQASKTDIISPRDVIDREATKIVQQEAVDRALATAKQEPDYYLIDESVRHNVTFKLNRFFELIEQLRKQYISTGVLSKEEIQGTRFQSFFNSVPKASLIKNIIALSDQEYQVLKEKSHQILVEVESSWRINTNNLPENKLELPQVVADFQVTPELSPVLTELLQLAVRPNLVLNTEKLTKLENEIRSEVPYVIRRQNEVLIAKNQVITESDLKMLEELNLIVDRTSRIKTFLGLSLFILLMIGLSWGYIFLFHPDLFKKERLLYLLMVLVLLAITSIKVLSLVDNPAVPYLAPAPFGAMLITILIHPQLALAVAVILSLVGGIVTDFNLAITVFYFVSQVIAVLTLVQFHRQRDLVRTGFILMFANALTASILNLLFRTEFNYVAVFLAAINGILSAVLAIGLLPFVEHLFKITSPIRVLELANPGQPLLRRLQIEAPGTYQHSIMVGNLAEAAAPAIGADPLWSRVGSYYHDIGKIKRPYFFVENQFSQDNPHEKLNPTLSTLIITSHVKEGADIAREHGLPEQLVDIVEQHHGTDLVRYFYKRATENAQNEKENLSETAFRYEGPKPRTKEAALVMLADSVEAAVRALPKPTPAKVEALVQKIIMERLDDGQFDECDLTLKNLNAIKNSFIKTLGGLYHNRIEYPETVLKEMERKKMSADSSK